MNNIKSLKTKEDNIYYLNPLISFNIQKAQQKDLNEILEFIFIDFLFTEPLNASLGLTRTESEKFFNSLVTISLKKGLSYLIKDPNENNKLIAIRLTSIIKRNKRQNGETNGIMKECNSFVKESLNVQKIIGILNAVESKTWDLVPSDINCLASWLIISVSSDYKRRGIAEALLNYNLEEIEEYGCEGLITEASAFNSQKLFQKMGYTRLFEIKHSEWKGEDGKQIFNCKDGTDKITLEFKQFNKLNNFINGI
ncbi:hypothetical protein ACQ4LE_007421 [Meloidogyne hapla]